MTSNLNEDALMDSSSPQAKDDFLKDNDGVEETKDDFGTTCPVTGSKRKENPRSADSSIPSNSKKKNTSTRFWIWDRYTRMKEDKNKCICHYWCGVRCCATTNGT